MPKKFTWLFDSQIARNKKKLVKGETYDTKEFPKNVVAYWVEKGQAKYVTDKSKKEK